MNIENNEHYKLMGCDKDDKIVIKCKISHRTHFFSTNDLGKQYALITIAPLDFWAQFQSGTSSAISRKDRVAIRNNLRQRAEAMSMYEHGYALGGGAAKDSRGILVFNTGNKLYQQSHSHSETLDEVIGISESIDDNFEGSVRIKVADDTSQGEDYCRALCKALMRYRWEEPNDGAIFCGWIVTALIGGALPHRPAIWINAPTGAGKTYLFEKLNTILEGMVLPTANTTEAGLITYARKNDSLAVLLDEFEPAWHSYKNNLKIMKLTRIAASGEGLRPRGGGKVKAINLRFSTAFATRNQLRLSVADRSHIYNVNLSHKGVEDWASVESDIENIVTPEKCLVIRSHIIKNLPKIMNLFEKWQGIYSKDETDKDTQSVLIGSSLSAGYEFLSGEALCIQSKSKMIQDYDTPDAETILGVILGLTPSTKPNSRSISIMMACNELAKGNSEIPPAFENVKKAALNHGVKIMKKRAKEGGEIVIQIAPTHEKLQKIFRNTEFANFSIYDTLSHYDGITIPENNSDSFSDISPRYVEVSQTLLEWLGLEIPPLGE